MEFRIKKDLQMNIVSLMKQAGYICLGRGTNEMEYSFVRSSEISGYPRFHLFVRFDKGKHPLFNLHLDQKKESYHGSSAHNAVYNDPIIEAEVERIISRIVV